MPETTIPDIPPDRFRSVVTDHQRTIYFVCRDLTGNHHDAEDLAQDVFVKAYHALHTLNGPLDNKPLVSGWLRRIAVNTYLNDRRAKKRTHVSVFPEEADASRPDAFGTAPSQTDTMADASIVQSRIARGLGVLTERERAAFTLRHFHGLPVQETAASLNVAPGTVKSLLHRAVRKLQVELSHLKEELTS
ncbi:MAG: sigma-70 family RNA polymerase sigma factor [Rhodothermales bacterium]